MSYKDYYTIKSHSEGWTVHKVSMDFEPQGGYKVSDRSGRLECECFASNKHTCRHRDMVRMYKANLEFRAKVDQGSLYNFDKDKWLAPIKQES
jgi:hypothetical protein